ncbi:MAG TPA: CDP-diacylglycerol--glycerol-3-phosphate 3-phosphatidyltransferase [candidate division Zixibacteria bacterium]|nr:CDP-diacylglycerol--glycerol-3-phosphate 3-phosphatidyltransferase [candidate division Zixibacteria bacterium]
MNLPNFLTILRIILAPLVFVALYFGGIWTAVGTAIFAIGALTDWMDGFLARRNKQVTGFGQFTDPVADKLLSGFALAAVSMAGFVPILPVIGIILRDVLITTFRLWGMSKDVKILPSRLAKAKTGIELLTLFVIMFYASFGGEPEGFWFGGVSIWIVFALAWITLADYFWKNRNILI